MDPKQLVYSAYNVLLGRDPDADGASFWQNKILNGMSREQFLHSIVSSDEFQKKKPAWMDLDLWQKCVDLNAEIILDLSIGKFCGPTADSTVIAAIVKGGGIYEPQVAKEIKECLKHGDTFLDIGANLGYFTLMASHLVGREGRVIAFEPVTEIYKYVLKNIEINSLSNVTLYKYGLWCETVEKTFGVPENAFGGAHIIPEKDYDRVNAYQEIIQCQRLDDIFSGPVKLIKMDIEGSEPYALQGMTRTIEKWRPTILCEMNRAILRNHFGLDADIYWKIFSSLGYSLYFDEHEIKSLEELKRKCPPDDLIDLVAVSG
jgi:FkbM family methyltransferase